MRLAWLALVLGCASGPDAKTRTAQAEPVDPKPVPVRDTDPQDATDTDTIAPTDTDSDVSGCPAGTVRITDSSWDFCIDRYEASLTGESPYVVPTSQFVVAASVPGVPPQGYISGVMAETACANAGKRLCDQDEWLRACQGPNTTTYPYGNTYDSTACNDTRSTHPIVELFGPSPSWSPTEMNDPRVNQLPDSLHDTGANTGCVSADGVYDMHGNLHEWIRDAGGVFKGGFYVDAVLNGPGCTYATTAHSVGYHDYSTGFRCCADPR